MKTSEHMIVVEGLIRRIVELEAKMLHERQSTLRASRRVVELKDKIEANLVVIAQQEARIQASQTEDYTPRTDLASIACFLNNLESSKLANDDEKREGVEAVQLTNEETIEFLNTYD